jgi:hypothetical protein
VKPKLTRDVSFSKNSAPAAGLGSNSNYFLHDNCCFIRNLSVEIHITRNLNCESTSGAQRGFGFQVNAYSPRGQNVVFQQYVLACIDNELIGAIDNWPLEGPNIINKGVNLLALPSSNIPAGIMLNIALTNDPADNVVGVTFRVSDDRGLSKANVTQNLLALPNISSDDVAPIVALQLNLVGPIGGETATLSSGEGEFIFSSANQLSVSSDEPSCIEAGFTTAETANSFYGNIISLATGELTQSFGIRQPPEVIAKSGRLRPRSQSIDTR